MGNAHFWRIGRGINDQDPQTTAHFGLVDECSKLNVNYASSNMLADMLVYQQNPPANLIASLLAWRNTNTSLVNGGAKSFHLHEACSLRICARTRNLRRWMNCDWYITWT